MKKLNTDDCEVHDLKYGTIDLGDYKWIHVYCLNCGYSRWYAEYVGEVD